MTSDLERVARAVCRHHALQYVAADGVDAYVDQYWRDHIDEAHVSMAETRRIDADALRDAIKNGDVWSNGWYASEWLEQRANAPQQ